MFNLKIFCERFKELRLEHELNYVKLAEILKVSNNTVKRWERGERLPNAENIYNIAIYFEVSADYLLGLEN